jgi:hypothetical protein
VALAPPILIQAVAGLALVGAFSGSAMAAFQEADGREAAAVTFLVTASGVPLPASPGRRNAETPDHATAERMGMVSGSVLSVRPPGSSPDGLFTTWLISLNGIGLPNR